MKEFSFNEREFLGTQSNSPQIYAHPSEGTVYSPFNLDLYQWERLLLVDFGGDPRYHTIELQSLNNEFGEGAVVIMYHKNGSVDVYCSKEVNISKDKYYWGSNWEIIGKTDIECILEYSETGIEAYLKMTDRYNKIIALKIKENHQNKELQNILAPLPLKNRDPEFFPFMYLQKFSPVNFEGTEMKIVIDGKERKPLMIPIKIRGERKYRARYSNEPCLGYWNRIFRGALKPLHIENGTSVVNDAKYSFVENAGHFEMSQIATDSDTSKIYFQFSPPIPDLLCLKAGTQMKGKFVGGTDKNSGAMGGEYTVRRDAGRISITVHPTKGWQPTPGKLWLRAYTWMADIEINNDEVSMASQWKIKKGLLDLLLRK